MPDKIIFLCAFYLPKGKIEFRNQQQHKCVMRGQEKH